MTKLHLGQVGEILLGPFFLRVLVMSDTIILLIIFCFLAYAALRYFSPHIETIQTGPRSFRVLLWYNHYEDIELKRKWIKLFEYEQR